MGRTVLWVFVALAVLAALACQSGPAGPSRTPPPPSESSVSASVISAVDFIGTWQATKAEGWRMVEVGGGFQEVAGSRRDLVAQGGTITLMLEATSEVIGKAHPSGKYTITVAMPGATSGVDTGFWFYGMGWGTNKGNPQIDFYPASLGPDPEYGWIPGFLVSLNGNTLKLWDSGLTFLPFDFGWGTTPGMNGTSLNLEFIRK